MLTVIQGQRFQYKWKARMRLSIDEYWIILTYILSRAVSNCCFRR